MTAWWELRLAPGTAHPVQFTRLPWTLAGVPLSFTVSPDGTKIAASFNETVPGSARLSPVRLYSLATGAVLRSWTFNGEVTHMGWTGDGRALVYQGNGSVLEFHDIATPGSDLAAGSTPLFTVGSAPGLHGAAQCSTFDWAVSADGTTFTCAASAVSGWHCSRRRVPLIAQLHAQPEAQPKAQPNLMHRRVRGPPRVLALRGGRDLAGQLLHHRVLRRRRLLVERGRHIAVVG